MSSQGCYDEAVLNSSPLPAKQESAGLEPISTLTQGKSRRRLYILIVVLVLALIGAIVGGVVGGLSRRNHDASSEESTSIPVTSVASDSPTKTVVVDSSTSSTISSTPTPTATLQSLRPNSKLAVTGWRADGGFNIRLFYQDRKDNLRFSEYSSDEDSWSSSNKVLATDVMSGTPIGVGTHVPVDPVSFHHVDHSEEPKALIVWYRHKSSSFGSIPPRSYRGQISETDTHPSVAGGIVLMSFQ